MTVDIDPSSTRHSPRLLLCGFGYLGKEIARQFAAAGWQVTAVSLSGADGSLACDLADASAVAALAAAVPVPDAMVHCASSGRGGPDAYHAVYQNGCAHLLDRFPGVPLLFTSSTSVYAQTDGSEVTEESPALPARETGRILLEAERAVLEQRGIVARLAGIYGPGRSVILSKFLLGHSVIEDEGQRFLNQIHRDDAAAAILHLTRLHLDQARPAPALFNIVDSTPMSQLELHQHLATLFDRPLPPFGPRDSARKRGWTHKRVSNAKLRATGWQPRFPAFVDAAPAIATTLDILR